MEPTAWQEANTARGSEVEWGLAVMRLHVCSYRRTSWNRILTCSIGGMLRRTHSTFLGGFLFRVLRDTGVQHDKKNEAPLKSGTRVGNRNLRKAVVTVRRHLLRERNGYREYALMYDIIITNPCVPSLLVQSIKVRGYAVMAAVKGKHRNYKGPSCNTFKLLHLAISPCGHYPTDSHRIIKDLRLPAGHKEQLDKDGA